MRRPAGTLLFAIVLLVASLSPVFAQTPAPTSTTAAEALRLKEESDRLEAIAAAAELRPAPREIDFGAQLLRSLLVLAGVCVFAYLVLGKALPRLMRMTSSGRRAMYGVESRGVVEVIDRLPLEPRRVIYVLKVGGSHFLVGSVEQGMSMIARLSDEDVESAKAIAERAARGAGLAGGLFGRLSKKEGQT